MQRDRVEVVPARGTPRGGVVLVSDVTGVDATLRGWANRLVDVGFAVVMPDLWWRGPPSSGGPEEIAAALADYDALADIAFARDALPPDLPRFVLGFGLGGLHARIAACVMSGLDGAVDFQGRIVYPTITAKKPAQPLDLLLGLGCPLQGHYGEDDPVAPLEHVARLEERLGALPQPALVYTYPGCGTAFMDRSGPSWNADSARTAWARAVAFLDHLAARVR